jgi:hypothetical protein
MPLKNITEFYNETLARSGITPYAAEPVEKTAAALGKPVEVVKMAAAIFQQLQLDKVDYPTEEDRRDDALKLAEKFVAYRDGETAKAAALADQAMLAQLRAAAASIAEHKIAGVTPADFLRMAVMQLDSMDESTKAAAWAPDRAPATQALLATSEASKVASVIPELAAWTGRNLVAVPGAGATAFLEV